MRICFVCHSGSPTLGGAERCTLEAMEALRKKGVDCVALVPEPAALYRELVRRGFTTRFVIYTWWMSDDCAPWSRLKRLLRNLYATVPVALQIRRWRCDVVYTNTAAVWVGAAAAKLLGLRHVWHIYEFGYEDHGFVFDWGRDFSYRLMGRLSAVCIAVSKAIEAHYAPFIPKDKLKLVYFAVDVPAESDEPCPTFGAGAGLKCLLAGRLHPNKGQEDAIRAVADLKGAGVEAELLLAGRGDPPRERRLKELCRELGVDARVRFLGQVANVFRLMKSADVIFMCSRQEALGRVTVEGMYAARPIIGARSGGTPELVEDGVNGFLYEPGDHRGLADKARYVAEHREEAARLGENGRRRAIEKFSRERLGDDLWAVVGLWKGGAR